MPGERAGCVSGIVVAADQMKEDVKTTVEKLRAAIRKLPSATPLKKHYAAPRKKFEEWISVRHPKCALDPDGNRQPN